MNDNQTNDSHACMKHFSLIWLDLCCMLWVDPAKLTVLTLGRELSELVHMDCMTFSNVTHSSMTPESDNPQSYNAIPEASMIFLQLMPNLLWGNINHI